MVVSVFGGQSPVCLNFRCSRKAATRNIENKGLALGYVALQMQYLCHATHDALLQVILNINHMMITGSAINVSIIVKHTSSLVYDRVTLMPIKTECIKYEFQYIRDKLLLPLKN